MLERKIRYSCISVLFLATMQIISLSRCHSPFLDQTSSLLDHPLGDIYNVTTERSKRFVSSVAKPKFLSEKTLINYTLDRGFESISTPFFIEKRQVYEYLAYHNIPTDKKIIYFVTPTYMRPTQLVDMVRLSQTLQLDKVIYWVVIEDSPTGTVRMRDLLERSGLMFAHLSIETIQKPRVRGARQRNLGLDVIESVGIPGVAYFGDDDNAYDVRLFEEIRKTSKVGVFGVAFRGGSLYSRCQVNPSSGKVVSVISKWYKASDNFAIDMAGFSVSTPLLQERHARFVENSPPGRLEHTFLKQLVEDISEMEPLAENCTKIYAWHVQTSVGHFEKPIDSNWKGLQAGV